MNTKSVRSVPATIPTFRYVSQTSLGTFIYVLRDVSVVRSDKPDHYNLTGIVVAGNRNGEILPPGNVKTLYYVHESAVRDGFNSVGIMQDKVRSVGSSEYVSENPVKVRERFFRGIKSKK